MLEKMLKSTPKSLLYISLASINLLFSCSSENNNSTQIPAWQVMTGRDWGGDHTQRATIYRARVPNTWLREDPDDESSIQDSTLANCTFSIPSEDQNILITVHSFPYEKIEDRVPPNAQIARWKRQFETVHDPVVMHAQSHGGFSGLYLEISGEMKHAPTTVLAWAMQLAPEHYRNLMRAGLYTNEVELWQQKASDYTIKAVGAPESILAYKEEIEQFARSFELIDAIPTNH